MRSKGILINLRAATIVLAIAHLLVDGFNGVSSNSKCKLNSGHPHPAMEMSCASYWHCLNNKPLELWAPFGSCAVHQGFGGAAGEPGPAALPTARQDARAAGVWIRCGATQGGVRAALRRRRRRRCHVPTCACQSSVFDHLHHGICWCRVSFAVLRQRSTQRLSTLSLAAHPTGSAL